VLIGEHINWDFVLMVECTILLLLVMDVGLTIILLFNSSIIGNENCNFIRGVRMSEMFDVLNGALDEAIEDAKSEKKFLRRETISIEIEPLTSYLADEVKEIRHSTGLTQGLFAKWLGVSKRTVEAWEAGRNTPSGPSSRLLQLLQSHVLTPVAD